MLVITAGDLLILGRAQKESSLGVPSKLKKTFHLCLCHRDLMSCAVELQCLWHTTRLSALRLPLAPACPFCLSKRTRPPVLLHDSLVRHTNKKGFQSFFYWWSRKQARQQLHFCSILVWGSGTIRCQRCPKFVILPFVNLKNHPAECTMFY